MYSSRWLARIAIALAPIATAAWMAACAADVGDPTKALQLSTGGDSAPAPQPEAGVEAASLADSSPPPPGVDATSFLDATNPSDTTTPLADSPSSTFDSPTSVADTSMPQEAEPVDTGPPPPPPTGCAAGATIIAMTKTGNSGNFGTADAVCVTYMGTVSGWNASSVMGRTVTAVGSTTQMPAITSDQLGNQPGLAPGADGYIYWNYSAGAESYTSMSTF